VQVVRSRDGLPDGESADRDTKWRPVCMRLAGFSGVENSEISKVVMS